MVVRGECGRSYISVKDISSVGIIFVAGLRYLTNRAAIGATILFDRQNQPGIRKIL